MIAASLYFNSKDTNFRLSYNVVPRRMAKPGETLKFGTAFCAFPGVSPYTREIQPNQFAENMHDFL